MGGGEAESVESYKRPNRWRVALLSGVFLLKVCSYMSINSIQNQFRSEGYANLGVVVSEAVCNKVFTEIKKIQDFSSFIFLDEKKFLENPQYKNVNPIPGRNILENLEDEVEEIEQSKGIVDALHQVLGENYVILNKKVICGVPESWIPGWVLERIKTNPVNNLGAYVKPEFRHVTYFYGIDFHQDIIDWSGREPDFVTLYIYLHRVDKNSAPLNLLPKSHHLGVDKFPHELISKGGSCPEWSLKNQINNVSLSTRQKTILGDAGNVAFWHSYTIHGTTPNINSEERLSLRYLIAKNSLNTNTLLDSVNAEIDATIFESDMREDLLGDGQSKVKLNYLYNQQKSND